MRRAHAAALARRASRRCDSLEIQSHEQRLAIGARHGEIQHVRGAFGTAAMNNRVRHARENQRLQAVAELPQPEQLSLVFRQRNLRGGRKTYSCSNVLGSRPSPAILRAAMHEWLKLCPASDE